MDDRLSALEAQVHDLQRSVAMLEARLATVETGPPLTAAPTSIPDVASLRDVRAVRDEAGAVLALVGRALVVLGGAYLLRALTDSGILPQWLGIRLGLVYALVWIAAADRDAGRARRSSAAFHSAVGVIVAFPLIAEAIVRFRYLSPTGGAVLLAAITALTTAVAARRHVEAIAWIAFFGGVPVALASIGMTGSIVPFAVYLIAFGVATLWLGYAREWTWLRWPAALIADVVVLAITFASVGSHPAASPGATMAVQLLLLNGYLVSIVIRTIFRARDVIAFEVVQAPVALAVAFGGAVYVAAHTGSGTTLLAIVSLVFGIGCYAVAVAFARQHRPRNFHFYSSFALVLVLAGTTLLLPAPVLALLMTAAAIAAIWCAARWSTAVLAAHGIVYLLAAGIASGMLATALAALAAPAGTKWLALEPVAVVVLAGYVVGWTIAAPPARGAGAAAARLALAVLVVFAVVGGVVAQAGSLLPPEQNGGPDPGAIATLRTAVLALAAIALAWTGRSARFKEAGWLLYPVLAVAGLKLLAEDLPRSRPSTLFVALAAYGFALIVTARLGRHAVS